MSAGRVKVFELQSALRPQAKVLLLVSVEQGVIAISALSTTAISLRQTNSSPADGSGMWIALPVLQKPAHAAVPHVLSVQLLRETTPPAIHAPPAKQKELLGQHAESEAEGLQGVSDVAIVLPSG